MLFQTIYIYIHIYIYIYIYMLFQNTTLNVMNVCASPVNPLSILKVNGW